MTLLALAWLSAGISAAGVVALAWLATHEVPPPEPLARTRPTVTLLRKDDA